MRVSNKVAVRVDCAIFAGRLKQAIKRRGLTYIRAAELVRERLAEGLSISHTSIWLYASGRSVPRRMEIFRALCDEFDIVCAPDENDSPLDEQETFSERQLVFAIGGPRQEIQLLLRDSGCGVAFISFEAEVEWEKALQIATILRNDRSDAVMVREAPHELHRAAAIKAP